MTSKGVWPGLKRSDWVEKHASPRVQRIRALCVLASENRSRVCVYSKTCYEAVVAHSLCWSLVGGTSNSNLFRSIVLLVERAYSLFCRCDFCSVSCNFTWISLHIAARTCSSFSQAQDRWYKSRYQTKGKCLGGIVGVHNLSPMLH
jgi:hypothetical protein